MKIIIAGPGGSGKDYLKAILVKKGLVPEVSYTTRLPREGEVDGVNYHYITETEFRKMIEVGQMVEWNVFNGWYYGTSCFGWNDGQVFIMTPEGVAQIKEMYGLDEVLVIYINLNEGGVIKERLSARKGSAGPKEVERRMAADFDAFLGFSDFDIQIKNSDF